MKRKLRSKVGIRINLFFQEIFLHMIIPICIEQEPESSFLWLFSILSGPILACGFGAFLCLVPIHNVLEQPAYWYEDQLTRFTGSPVLVVQMMVRAEQWSGFVFKHRWSTYLFMEALCMFVYAIMTFSYYFLWTCYYKFSLPLPMSQHLSAFTVVLVMNVVLWFR